MNDADTYFDAEVAFLAGARSQAKAEALASERKKQAERERQLQEHRRRRKFMVDVDRDEDEICLLDIEADKLQAALDEIGSGASLSIEEGVLRNARGLYLVGRKEEAAEVIYPAIRDALGVAL